MQPLAVLTYYLRNKFRLMPVFGVLALAVFGISLTGVLTGSIQDTARQRLEVYRGAVQISPSLRNGHDTLDATLEGELRRNPNLEALYPDIRLSTYMPNLAGDTSTYIFAVDQEVFPVLMQRFNLELAVGRLPRPDTNELALHETVMKARGLKPGAVLDRDLDQQEFLTGKMEVVGVLRGPSVLSLASLEYVGRRQEFRGYPRSMLALPRLNAQAALEKDLRALDEETARAFIYSVELQRFQKDFASLDTIVWAINSVVVIVLSLLVGLLNLIYFLDRMNEFGLLLGIGYSPQFVIRRALVESLVLTGLAWGFGILFSQMVYSILNALVFEPRGITLSLLNWRAIQFTLPVPIAVGLFAGATVVTQLRRLDPISIIERRD